ncbi:hypothetical protein ACET3Z_009762 [Daucus carota]
MDSWSEIQLKKMEIGGNDRFNDFMKKYGVSKETSIVEKYNTNAARVYRERVQALAEGRPWRDPPVVRETVGRGKSRPPVSGVGGSWDNWESFDEGKLGADMRRNNTVGDFRSGGGGRGFPSRSKSTQDIYTKAQLEASAAGKEDFFARKMAENQSRPDGLPPSQGGKYVGFGSSPGPMPRSSSQGDVLYAVSQGIGRLSMAAASAAQSAATVVQAGTKDLTSKVMDGGYDYRVNETVNVVSAKTSEIGHRTWGIMKGVMALASLKVEEYTREGNTATTDGWNNDSWQNNASQGNGYYQDSGSETRGWNSSGRGQNSTTGHQKSPGSGSWDDWDSKDKKSPQNADSWAGWDDTKEDDDEDDSYYRSPPSTSTTGGRNGNGKSDSNWTGGGFR